jgi:hypothetical protein
MTGAVTVLTEDEAINRATLVVREKRITVLAVEHVRKVLAAQAPPGINQLDDLWIVRFSVPTLPDRASPSDAVIIRVNDRTGAAELVLGR